MSAARSSMKAVADRAGAAGAEWAGRTLGALLRFDERLVNRLDPRPLGPVDPASLPWAATVESRWAEMRAELDALLVAGIEFPETDDLAGMDQGTQGRWTSYILHWYGTTIDRTAARCPITTEIAESVPGMQIAGYTVLHPHSHLPRHQGPAKSLRYQIGLRIPGPPGSCTLQVDDEVLEWFDGRSLAFDDRSFHAATNASDEVRYVLFIQVAWPLGGAAGRVHRVTSRAFGAAARRIARRADDLDRRLNGRAPLLEAES